jgi:hypothetical protein
MKMPPIWKLKSVLALMAILLIMGGVVMNGHSQPGTGTVHAQAAVPAAPTGLTMTSVSHDSVSLSWDDPDDDSITGYLVLRRDVVNQAPGVFSTIESDTGSSAMTSVSHDSVSLSWDDPDDDSITGYLVLRRDVVNQAPGVFSTIESDTGSSATTYTDNAVSAETRYTYRVKAINPEGTSKQSKYVNVNTPAGVPAAPTGLTTTSVSHDSVSLSWDDPDDDSITGYLVLRRDVVNQEPGVFSTIESDTGSSATTYTDNAVSAETRYTYRVKAINPEGTSKQSNYIKANTPAAPPPDRPSPLTRR